VVLKLKLLTLLLLILPKSTIVPKSPLKEFNPVVGTDNAGIGA
jgi:hypothetical protein